MSDIDTARLRALANQMLDIESRRLNALSDPAVGYVEYVRVAQECDGSYYKLHREAGPKTIVALLDRIAELERTAAAAGRALREAQEREAQLTELMNAASDAMQFATDVVQTHAEAGMTAYRECASLTDKIHAAIAAKEQS